MLAIIIGARTWGKTYQLKKKMLNKYLKNKEKSIYLRRFETELKEVSKNLFDDTNSNLLPPEHRIICDKSNIWYQSKEELIKKNGESKIKWNSERLGYLMNIAIAQNIKSGSYRDVTTFCFDEFLIEDKIHHYFNAEVNTVLRMINTVNRDRSGNEKCKCYFLANAVTQYNPYFQFWKIKNLNDEQHYYLDFNPQIVVYYDRNEEFSQQIMKGEYGELIRGTAEERYQVQNQFLLDLNNDFIHPNKPIKAKYLFTLLHKNKMYGIYYSYAEMKYWISNSADKNYRHIFASTGEDLKPNVMLLKENMFFKYLKSAYRNGILFYENLGIYKEIEDMLNLLNIF